MYLRDVVDEVSYYRLCLFAWWIVAALHAARKKSSGFICDSWSFSHYFDAKGFIFNLREHSDNILLGARVCCLTSYLLYLMLKQFNQQLQNLILRHAGLRWSPLVTEILILLLHPPYILGHYCFPAYSSDWDSASFFPRRSWPTKLWELSLSFIH